MSAVFDRAVDSIALANAERLVDTLRMKRQPRRDALPEGYSVRRLLDNLAHDKRHGYLEAEISADLERTHPTQHNGRIIPWEAFTRADIVGTSTAGGYLTESANIDAADALRPNMVVGALGATFIPAPYGANVNLPRLTGTSTASWLTSETSGPISETDQTFGQVAYTPHTVGSYTEISRLAILQAAPSPAEFVVTRDLIAVVARAADFAALFGGGINGQPRGLANMAGVSTFSGTTLNLAGVVNAAVALGDALDDSAGIAANRTTAGTLAQRQILGGSERVWMGSLVAGTCCGYPARSSSQITSGALFLGSFRFLNIVVWGNGVEIAVNPYAAGNFKTGIVGIRAFLTIDTAPTFPSAFNYASAVT